MTTLKPPENRYCSASTMRFLKWRRILSVAAIAGGLLIPAWLYASTYKEVRSQVSEIESIDNRALQIDAMLSELCSDRADLTPCFLKLRELLGFLKDDDATPAISRLALGWGQKIAIENCGSDRCNERIAWMSGIGDPNYDPKYYSAKPEELKAYIESQLQKTREQIKSHDAARLKGENP